MAEKDAKKKLENEDAPRASALAAYVPGPKVPEPDDVGEVEAVEPAGGAPSPAAEADETSVLPPQQIRAVIAYKQPVTLPEIIALRGVKSGGVVKTLLEKRLIRITGRKEVVGRPMLYGTTKQFLLHFGLKDLGELPRIEEFAEVLGEEVDIAGLKRAIESPLPVATELADPEGDQIPLFEGPPPESGDGPGGETP